MPVKIVTDNVPDPPYRVVPEPGITTLPLHVRSGTEVCRNGVYRTTDIAHLNRVER